MVAAAENLINEQVDSGAYEPPDDPRVLADGFVSLGERFLYHGGDSDEPGPANRQARDRTALARVSTRVIDGAAVSA